MALNIVLNGDGRGLDSLTAPAPLTEVVRALTLKSDRIAIEHNGQIVRRSTWDTVMVQEGDRLEIVHFVGGGASWPG